MTYNPLLPYLLGVAQLDFGSLLDKLGVALHKLDAPLRVLLQVIKLILMRDRKREEFLTAADSSHPRLLHIN